MFSDKVSHLISCSMLWFMFTSTSCLCGPQALDYVLHVNSTSYYVLEFMVMWTQGPTLYFPPLRVYVDLIIPTPGPMYVPVTSILCFVPIVYLCIYFLQTMLMFMCSSTSLWCGSHVVCSGLCLPLPHVYDFRPYRSMLYIMCLMLVTHQAMFSSLC